LSVGTFLVFLGSICTLVLIEDSPRHIVEAVTELLQPVLLCLPLYVRVAAPTIDVFVTSSTGAYPDIRLFLQMMIIPN